MATKGLLLIHPMADEKIRTWVDLAETEISGVGVMEELPKGWQTKGRAGFYVKDVVLLKQWNTSGGTHLDPAELDKWLLEQQGEDPEAGIDLFWWHSHVNFGVFWSQTDEECVRSFLGHGFLGSVVYNKKRESLARLDVMIGGTQIEIEAEMKVQPVTYNVKEECEEQFKRLSLVGTAPKREWKSEKNRGRLEEVEEAEKKEREATREAVTGWQASRGGYVQERAWVRCSDCISRPYCARPVIYRNQTGCMGKKELLPVMALEKGHWVEAKKLGTLIQLQSWRDKRIKDVQDKMRERGNPTRTIMKSCKSVGCCELISNQEKDEFELGYCKKCINSGKYEFFA